MIPIELLYADVPETIFSILNIKPIDFDLMIAKVRRRFTRLQCWSKASFQQGNRMKTRNSDRLKTKQLFKVCGIPRRL